MREKAAVIGEYQSIQDQLQAELDKAKFDLRELEVTTETLRIENKQMVQEIAEISGDAAVDRSAVPRQNNIPDRNEISPDAFGATYGTEADSSSKDLGTFTNKSMAMTGDSPPSSFSLISALSLSLSLFVSFFLYFAFSTLSPLPSYSISILLSLCSSLHFKSYQHIVIAPSLCVSLVESILLEGEDVRAERSKEGRRLLDALCSGNKVDKKTSEALAIWMNGERRGEDRTLSVLCYALAFHLMLFVWSQSVCICRRCMPWS
jgi:hypothetical protein